VEDTFWVDIGRVERGSLTYDQVIGNTLRLMRFAQEQYKHGKVITHDQWKMEGFFDCLVPVFAEKCEDGYHVRGAHEKFGWLKQKVEAGQNGGLKSGESRRSEINSLVEAAGSGVKRVEPSPSSSLSIGSKEPNINSPSGFEWLVELWNRNRGALAEVRAINPGSERHRMVTSRMKLLKTQAQWEQFIKSIEASDFLSGRNEVWVRQDGTPVCDFDWCLKKKNAEKILAGNFTNKTKEVKSNQWVDKAKLVLKAISKYGDGDPKVREFLGDELWITAMKSEGGFYAIRRMPNQPWVVNKLAGLLKESAAKQQGDTNAN
jgi:hypothetical protein